MFNKAVSCIILFALAGLALTASGCGAHSAATTSLEVALTYAKDAARPLTDVSNIGAAAPGRKVNIRAIEQRAQGGQPVFVAGKPLFTLTSDADGTVRVELPPNRYLVEVLDADGNVIAKQLPEIRAGLVTRIALNLPPH